MVTTILQPNNQNSTKMRRIRVHVVLILILASLYLAVYWANGVIRESTDLFIKKLESTSVFGSAKNSAHDKLASLDQQLFDNPNGSIEVEVAKIKKVILQELNAEESGYIASLYVDFIQETDNSYRQGLVKSEEWEKLLNQFSITIQMNRTKWLNEIEQSKLKLFRKIEMPRGTQEINQITKIIPGSVDFEVSQRKIEESVLFLLNRAHDTLSNSFLETTNERPSSTFDSSSKTSDTSHVEQSNGVIHVQTAMQQLINLNKSHLPQI